MAPTKPPSVSGGKLADSLPPQSITTYVLEPTSVPSPSATPTSCSSQTFLSVVGGDDVISGQPRCADGYALQIFTAGVGGQAAPFFFKQGSNGVWTLIEGGDAIPTIACSTIPANVLTKLGAQCPGAALAPSAQQSPSASAGSGCSSDVFMKIMQSQGATVTSASGAPKCGGGYAEQNFNYPKGPAANYPTFFFKAGDAPSLRLAMLGIVGGRPGLRRLLVSYLLAAACGARPGASRASRGISRSSACGGGAVPARRTTPGRPAGTVSGRRAGAAPRSRAGARAARHPSPGHRGTRGRPGRVTGTSADRRFEQHPASQPSPRQAC